MATNNIINNNITEAEYRNMVELRDQSRQIFTQRVSEIENPVREHISRGLLSTIRSYVIRHAVEDLHIEQQRRMDKINNFAQPRLVVNENTYNELQQNVTDQLAQYHQTVDQVIEQVKTILIGDIEHIVTNVRDSFDEVGRNQIQQFGDIYNRNTPAYTAHRKEMERLRQEERRRQRQMREQEARERFEKEMKEIGEEYQDIPNSPPTN